MDVCSLLLSHGADPSLLNCHSKSAVDVCPSDDLQEKLQCMERLAVTITVEKFVIYHGKTYITYCFALWENTYKHKIITKN